MRMQYQQFSPGEHAGKHYVYIYLDKTRPGTFNYGEYSFPFEPFYVGKGKDNRAHAHLYDCWKSKSTNVKRDARIRTLIEGQTAPLIWLVHWDIDENLAYRLETKLICAIGIEHKLEGPLYNIVKSSIRYPTVKGQSKQLTPVIEPTIAAPDKQIAASSTRKDKKLIAEIIQILREMPDLSLKEIANAMNVSYSLVWNIKNRTTTRFKRMYESIS